MTPERELAKMVALIYPKISTLDGQAQTKVLAYVLSVSPHQEEPLTDANTVPVQGRYALPEKSSILVPDRKRLEQR